MALVKFVSCDLLTYQGLDSRDQDTLYFIKDVRQIRKGDVAFTGGVFTTVTSLPETGEVNTLYVNSTDGSVSYWNGTSYQTVVKATGTSIEGAGDANHLATTKAVVDYVASKVAELDVSALAGRVGTLETTVGKIPDQISAAQSAAEAKAQELVSTLENGTVTNISDTVDALRMGKADRASTLAGYGITDAYTKSETDSAITTAIANADHLKRAIVDVLPEVGAADEHTIYMVPKADGSGQYDEYMVITDKESNKKFEKIGDSAVDLTDYATKGYVDTAKAAAVTEAGTQADAKIAGAIDALDVADSEIADQYVSAVSQENGKVKVTRKALPAKQVVAEGATDGTISVDGSDVAVHGLKSAAFTESSDYATAAQGAKADTALQKADIAAGGANGTVSVKGADVAVTGLKSAAYADTGAFDAAGAAVAAEKNAKGYTDTKVDPLVASLTWQEL